MKKVIIWATLGLIVIATVFILFSNKKKAEQKVYRFDENSKIAVTAEVVKFGEFKLDKIYNGTFEPNKEAKLMFELPGKISKINYEVGEYVSNGSVIANLDMELLKLQKEQAELQVSALENDFKRYKTLLEEEAVQLVQFEKIETAYKTAQVQLKTINEQIRKSSLKAPFNGIITMKFIEIGTVTAPQMPVVQLSDVSKLRMTIQVPENEIKYFKMNETVDIKTDLSSDKIYEGKVVVISGKSDMAHNFMVQVEILNSDLQIKAGTFGYVFKRMNTMQKQISIPISALFGSSIMPKVYVVENEKAILKEIEVLDKNNNFAAVKSGLKEGDIVVTSGFINLSDGKNVLIKNNSEGD